MEKNKAHYEKNGMFILSTLDNQKGVLIGGLRPGSINIEFRHHPTGTIMELDIVHSTQQERDYFFQTLDRFVGKNEPPAFTPVSEFTNEELLEMIPKPIIIILTPDVQDIKIRGFSYLVETEQRNLIARVKEYKQQYIEALKERDGNLVGYDGNINKLHELIKYLTNAKKPAHCSELMRDCNISSSALSKACKFLIEKHRIFRAAKGTYAVIPENN